MVRSQPCPLPPCVGQRDRATKQDVVVQPVTSPIVYTAECATTLTRNSGENHIAAVAATFQAPLLWTARVELKTARDPEPPSIAARREGADGALHVPPDRGDEGSDHLVHSSGGGKEASGGTALSL
eukprot:CAMPEP_0113527858 /NCGR_PEP_ID=MMETSP0015_2-20120614/1527_1 /TAXON_ID=2838 /ORGANISM="Odontella" /LENGTH=125 /DNA_ID=CAMNT_0000426335 /DNA_START=212 /DNA_END=591 /DNA_ORIENTATION=+ /assembly_acc=CAM_ASM_000160